VPEAATEKVTVWPAVTVWLAGCVVIAALTLRVAVSLVTQLKLLLTVTRNFVPSSAAGTGGVV
jgi:hypothetical protein